MSSVTFHVNVGNRQDYLCRLARKSIATGTKTVMLIQLEALDVIDLLLWTVSDSSFLAHCRNTAAPSVLARSDLILTTRLQPGLTGQVLVNTSDRMPDGYRCFDRVIEVVGTDDSERQAARLRWRQYSGCGDELLHFDAQGRVESP